MEGLDVDSADMVQPKRKLSRLKRAKENSPPARALEPCPRTPGKPKDSAFGSSVPFSPSGQALLGNSPSQRGKRLMLPSRFDAEEARQAALISGPSESSAGVTPAVDASLDKGLAEGADCPAGKLAGVDKPGDSGASPRHSQSESGAGSDERVGSDRPCNKSMSLSMLGSDADVDQEEYWDEEDELGDYIKRQAARETKSLHKEKGPSESGCTASQHSGGISERSGHDSDSDGSDAHSGGQVSPGDTNAGNQRVLREAAQRDCIGKGEAPEIMPLTGVLERIKMRAAAAAQRAAMTTRAIIPSPPPRSFPHKGRPAPSDDDELMIESDGEDHAAVALLAPAAPSEMRLLSSQGGIVEGAEASKADDRPKEAMQLSLVLDSHPHQEEPFEEPEARLQNAAGLRVLLPADEVAMMGPQPTPAMSGHLESRGENGGCEWDRVTTSEEECGHDRSHWAPRRPRNDSTTDEDRRAAGHLEPTAAEQALPSVSGPYPGAIIKEVKEGSGRPSRSASPATRREGLLSEVEEEDPSTSSSSSDSDSEADLDEDVEQQERRREEEMALLRDRPKKKKDRQLFEDEAEMSEDEGHSDDDDDDDDAEQEEILRTLIGHEKERKGDEKRRRALHAEWLAQQDEQQVQQLMDGVRNGFRRRNGPAFLQDDGGSLEDARRRRAGLAEQDGSRADSDLEEDSDEEGSGDPGLDDNHLDALSDDDAKEELRRYQAQKLLQDSQDVMQLDLLDGDSQEILGLLSCHLDLPAPLAKQTKETAPSRLGLAANTIKMSSQDEEIGFLGLTSSVPAAMTARIGSQNTRSFVFGREDSNSAPVPEADASEALVGPTSFAGIKLMAAANTGMSRAGRAGSFGLLGMLKPPGQTASLRGHGAAPLDLAGVLDPTKSRTNLARSK